MLSNESLSETWKRYDMPVLATFVPMLPMAANVGVRATLVDSNSGTKAMGAETFRFEPSAFNAEIGALSALGATGERIPPSHAMATAAHITIPAFLN